MGMIWFFNQFLPNLIFSVNILSSFTSQFSEVIMPLINYSKLGAQCHILCIHQFDTLKLNFVLIEASIYKHITTFQVDSVQSKLQACTFEVRKVVRLSESIVSWDLEELKIIFLVNCDFLDILCSSLHNVNVEFLQIVLRNLSKNKLKMSDLLRDGSTSISAFLHHAEFNLSLVQDCLV